MVLGKAFKKIKRVAKKLAKGVKKVGKFHKKIFKGIKKIAKKTFKEVKRFAKSDVFKAIAAATIIYFTAGAVAGALPSTGAGVGVGVKSTTVGTKTGGFLSSLTTGEKLIGGGLLLQGLTQQQPMTEAEQAREIQKKSNVAGVTYRGGNPSDALVVTTSPNQQQLASHTSPNQQQLASHTSPDQQQLVSHTSPGLVSQAESIMPSGAYTPPTSGLVTRAEQQENYNGIS